MLRKIIRKYWLLSRFCYPKKLRLEACTLCQLKCAGCFFQREKHRALGGGYLKFDNFKKIVNDNTFLKEIELSSYGEIFLNPDLVSIMKYAHEKGIALTAYNGVNFNTVTDEQIHALVDYCFRGITFSIDGATQQTYAQYRIGGDLGRVMNNVRKLIEYRDKCGSKYPKLVWQYIIMRHNELEVGLAKQMASELGMPISFKLDWDRNYQPVHVDYLKQETGLSFFTRNDYEKENKKAYKDYVCEELFLQPQINWDGRLLGCTNYSKGDYGVNVFEVGLKKALSSKQYQLAKKCLLTVHPSEHVYRNTPCYSCHRRVVREKNGKTLDV